VLAGLPRESLAGVDQPWPRISGETRTGGLLAVLATDRKGEEACLKNKMATLLVIVSAMLISAGMTWQQRLLFVGGIVFGSVVEALPDLVERLKETLTDRWRLSQVVKRSRAA
jgi:hypothetical protein